MIKQTIIVTGGSSGMGKAMAKRFAEEGHNVVITGRSQEKLDITKDELSALNKGSVYYINGEVITMDGGQWLNQHPF